MTDDDAIRLLLLSAERFAAADVPWSKAKFGLYGFQVVAPRQENISVSSQLERTVEAASLWDKDPNPYEPLIKFLESGGTMGRWEQGIIDVCCPSGAKICLPEQQFIKL